MSDKPTLALDVDSTLARSLESTARVIDGEATLTYEEATAWSKPVEQWGLEMFLDGLWEAWTDPSVWIPPFSMGMDVAVRNLQMFYEVDIVTDCPNDAVLDAKVAWLTKLGIDYNGFVATDPGAEESKADLGYDVYVDDHPQLPQEVGDDATVVQPARPYNEGSDPDHKYMDLSNVWSILQ